MIDILFVLLLFKTSYIFVPYYPGIIGIVNYALVKLILPGVVLLSKFIIEVDNSG